MLLLLVLIAAFEALTLGVVDVVVGGGVASVVVIVVAVFCCVNLYFEIFWFHL